MHAAQPAPLPVATARAKKRSIPLLTGTAAAEAIADFATGLTISRIPSTIRRKTERLLLMGIAAALAGSRHRAAPSLVRIQRRLGAAGTATVFGSVWRTTCAEAAFLNAAHAQVLDCNDGLPARGSYHPGRVLVPVALALAEQQRSSGNELLTALVAGYEVAARATMDGPRNRSDGLAAAIVAARVLGLSRTQTIHALLLSEQHGPRLYPGPENFDSDANHLSNGLIAKTAIESASFAQGGATAQLHGAISGLRWEADLPQRHRPGTFEISQAYIKPHNACRYCHVPIELALEFRAAHRPAVTQIDRVEIRLAVDWARFLERRVAPDAYFKSMHFSVPFTVACALLDGAVDLRQATGARIAAAEVQALQQRITLTLLPGEPAPADAWPAEMTIRLTDGRSFTLRKRHATGSAHSPLPDAELVRLFNAWSGPLFTARRKARICATVFALTALGDAGRLTALLRRA